MKKSSVLILFALVLVIVLVNTTGCTKSHSPIKFSQGTFPDSVYNLKGLNSQYDDYNSTIYLLGSSISILFSSNRGSSGSQFDLVQGRLWFQFDQTNGAFETGGNMTTDPFYNSVISKANTTGNDLGPLNHFSSADGYEYLFLASQNAGGPLDLYYLRYLPYFNTNMPYINGPFPVKLLNTIYDDAYISFDANEDSAYFTSNRNGNYDIFLNKRPAGTELNIWLDGDFTAATMVDSINSGFDDKCPFVYKNIMVFTSDKPGGMGGFDLYYSVFKQGKWSSPVNMGPKINTEWNEYRPLIGYHPDFKNMFILFSSDKPGGEGGYDLYLAGIKTPQ